MRTLAQYISSFLSTTLSNCIVPQSNVGNDTMTRPTRQEILPWNPISPLIQINVYNYDLSSMNIEHSMHHISGSTYAIDRKRISSTSGDLHTSDNLDNKHLVLYEKNILEMGVKKCNVLEIESIVTNIENCFFNGLNGNVHPL